MNRRSIPPACAALALVALAASAPAVLAGPPPDAKCEAKKLGIAAGYAACRLKAEAKATVRDAAPDHAKCAAAFAKKFAQAEEKAGPGVCPSEGDGSAIGTVVADTTAVLARLLDGPGGCAHADQDRSPAVVISDLLAAIAARDWAAVACQYHPNAFVIDDQGILVGRAEIASALESLFDLVGDTQIDVVEANYFRNVVRILYALDGGWFEIDDGVFTFVIEAGRIRHQTTHGLIHFNGPPPE